jgi:hypothetical protein
MFSVGPENSPKTKVNMQKILSSLTVLSAMLVGFTGFARGENSPIADKLFPEHVHVNGVGTIVAPDPLPTYWWGNPPATVDLGDAPRNPVAKPVPQPVAVQAVTPSVYVCGAPEALANDPIQTVKRCEWISAAQ